MSDVIDEVEDEEEVITCDGCDEEIENEGEHGECCLGFHACGNECSPCASDCGAECDQNCSICDGCGECQDVHSCYYCEGGDHYFDPDDGVAECGCCCIECGQSDTRGTTTTPPWVTRGIVLTRDEIVKSAKHANSYTEVWGFDAQKVPLTMHAASFYLLEPLTHRMLNVHPYFRNDKYLDYLQSQATEAMAEIVRELDPALLGYGQMAVWGEARYHIAIGNQNVVSGDRYQAWNEGRYIAEKVGPMVYKDLSELFTEMGDGSIGGPNWANCCDALYLRLTNKITKTMWLDRCFNLQHNGGSFLNKVTWQIPSHLLSKSDAHTRHHADFIRSRIGPAHAADEPDYLLLMQEADPEVRLLFEEWIDITNRMARRWGMRPMPKPKASAGPYTHEDFIKLFGAEVIAEAGVSLTQPNQMASGAPVDLTKPFFGWPKWVGCPFMYWDHTGGQSAVEQHLVKIRWLGKWWGFTKDGVPITYHSYKDCYRVFNLGELIDEVNSRLAGRGYPPLNDNLRRPNLEEEPCPNTSQDQQEISGTLPSWQESGSVLIWNTTWTISDNKTMTQILMVDVDDSTLPMETTMSVPPAETLTSDQGATATLTELVGPTSTDSSATSGRTSSGPPASSTGTSSEDASS